MVEGPTCAAQSNQMIYHCGVFRINYFLLVFIKPSAKMANFFTPGHLVGWGKRAVCAVCAVLLSMQVYVKHVPVYLSRFRLCLAVPQ